MRDNIIARIMLYIISIFLYLPYGISLYIGSLVSISLLYPSTKIRPLEQKLAPRLNPLLIVALCVFPQILASMYQLLPSNINETMSFMLSDGRAFVYPSPLFLLLLIIPILTRCYLFGFRMPKLRELFPPRICLLVLLMILCVSPLVFNWYELAQHNPIENHWRSIHLGLKSFYYNGLWEELYYRLLLIPILYSYFGRKVAIIFTALLFTVGHVDLVATYCITLEVSKLVTLGHIFLLGLLTGYIFCVTNSIVPCIVLHGISSGAYYLVSGIGKLLILQS